MFYAGDRLWATFHWDHGQRPGLPEIEVGIIERSHGTFHDSGYPIRLHADFEVQATLNRTLEGPADFGVVVFSYDFHSPARVRTRAPVPRPVGARPERIPRDRPAVLPRPGVFDQQLQRLEPDVGMDIASSSRPSGVCPRTPSASIPTCRPTA